MSESVRVQITGALWGVEADLYDGNGEVLADAAIAAYAAALLPLIERLTTEARAKGRAEVTAAVAAVLAEHWDWKAGRSLHAAVRAALTDRDALRKRDAAKWDEGYTKGDLDARAVQPTYPDRTTNPYLTGDAVPRCPMCGDAIGSALRPCVVHNPSNCVSPPEGALS